MSRPQFFNFFVDGVFAFLLKFFASGLLPQHERRLMNRNSRPCLKPFLGLFLAFILSCGSSLTGEVLPTYALVNCQIVPVSGPPIEKGIIIIRDGLIESIGKIGIVKIPEDAEVIEAEGLTAYPGLILAHTSLFLEAPKADQPGAQAIPEETQTREKSTSDPGLDAFKLLKPKKTTIDAYHRLGVTTVLVVPESGIFAGQSVLLNLNGERAPAMVVRNPVALHIHLVTQRGAYPSSQMGTMAFLRQSFLDASYYSAHRSRFNQLQKGLKRPAYDPFLEALIPYVVDKRPVVIHCANQEDIRRALRLREEFELSALLSGATEAWRVADAVKKSRLPLLVSLNFEPPLSSEYAQKGEEEKRRAEKEIYPANAKHLYEAGIPFALTSFGLTDTNAILKNVRATIQAGLPAEEALRAMTIIPARFLGVEAMLGSLEPGKVANVILTRGEIFAEKTEVEKVFVDGILFPIEKKEAAAPAALNLTGTWSVTVRSPMGEMAGTMKLEHEGTEIRGFIESEMGRWEIQEGTLSGNELSFTISAAIMGQSMEMAFSGRAEKDSFQGTISTPMGNAELRATRTPQQTI